MLSSIDDKFLMLLISSIDNMGVTIPTCGVEDLTSMV